MENFNKFIELIKDQFTYGGKKYAHSKSKEVTDILIDSYGINWLLGTIDKYTYRYKNLARERDLLKIATYQFLIWLKRGFHNFDGGSPTLINTNINIKKEFFPKFVKEIEQLLTYEEIKKILFDVSQKNYITKISETLKAWANINSFTEIPQISVLCLFILAFKEWEENYSHIAGKDKDTYNG